MRATTRIRATPRSIDDVSGASVPRSTTYAFDVVEIPPEPEPEPESEPKRVKDVVDDGLRRRLPKVKSNHEKFLERMEALGLRDQLVDVKPENTHGAEAGDDERCGSHRARCQ